MRFLEENVAAAVTDGAVWVLEDIFRWGLFQQKKKVGKTDTGRVEDDSF